jgi:hypothetical protein
MRARVGEGGKERKEDNVNDFLPFTPSPLLVFSSLIVQRPSIKK